MEGGKKNIEPLCMIVVILILSMLWINNARKKEFQKTMAAKRNHRIEDPLILIK